jgi:hypothetical protein
MQIADAVAVIDIAPAGHTTTSVGATECECTGGKRGSGDSKGDCKSNHGLTQHDLPFIVLNTYDRALRNRFIDIAAIWACLRQFFCGRGAPWSRPSFHARKAMSVLRRPGPSLTAAVQPLLKAREAVERQIADLDRKVLRLARNNGQVRRFMTAPGVGPITALCFLATIDDPTRFKRSRSIGAYAGLTTRRYASGEIDWAGRISNAAIRCCEVTSPRQRASRCFPPSQSDRL